MQKCSRAPHPMHCVGSCLTASQCPPLHAEKLRKEEVSWQKTPWKAQCRLITFPEAKAPRQLVYSCKPICLLPQKPHYFIQLVSSPWLSTKGSATLKQQKDNGQPSAGLARRNNSAWSDEPSSDRQERGTAGTSWVGFGCCWTADSLVLVFRGSPHLVNPNPQFSLSKKAPHMQSNNFQLSMQSPSKREVPWESCCTTRWSYKWSLSLTFREDTGFSGLFKLKTLKFCHKI